MRRNLRFKEFITGIIIFSLALFIFSIGIRSMSYSNPDEKRYIQSAEEMIGSGDWITPRYHGRPRFQKPILFYWLAALSASISGNNRMAARIPSAVCGAMTLLLTYLLGRDLYNRRTGLFSASLLCVSGIFFVYSRLATPDMATLFFITLSIYIFARLYFYDASKIMGSFFFLSIALATLTKGLAGLLIPLIIVISFIFVFKKAGIVRKINPALGLILFLAVVLPWFIMMYKIHGDIYIKHIWQIETVNRMHNLWSSDNNIFFKFFKNISHYLIMIFVVFLPSIIFLPFAIIDIVRRKNINREDLLVFFWIFTVIIFFSIIGSAKTHYLLSLAPPLCMVMGRYFSEATQKRGCVPIFTICSLVIFVSIYGYLLPNLSKEDGLLVLSRKISSMIEEGDRVGVGSNFISHNRLDAYLGMNVKKINVDIDDRRRQIARSRALLRPFLNNKKNRIFCLIIRQDYEDYIPDELKSRIFILDRGWYWKKPNQLRLDREAISSILRRDRAAFNRSFKNEIYLISNRP